jgi:hypothetical protein
VLGSVSGMRPAPLLCEMRPRQEMSVYEILWSMYEADHPWAPIATDFVLMMEDMSASVADIAEGICGDFLSKADLWSTWFGPTAKTAVVLLEIMSPPQIAGIYQTSLVHAVSPIAVETVNKIPDPRPIAEVE